MKLLALWLAALLFPAPQQDAVGFRQLVFTDSGATLGDYSFRLAEPDRPERPTAWQGPLTIASGAKSCKADVSLVTAVYGAAAMPFVVVVTYSGSNTYVHFIKTADCAKRWPSLKAFTEGVRVSGDRLSMLPACDGAGDPFPARCFAGRVYQLTAATKPQFLRNESVQLTRQTLGVAFTGEAMVSHPKSARARIVVPN